MTIHDRRLHAFRADLADSRLQGTVEAARFVAGRPAAVAVPVADIRRAPRSDAGLDTQALFGDPLTIFDEADGWAWVQTVRDGYVGYVACTALGPTGPAPTHRVAVPRSFVYSGPDLRLPPTRALSLGSALALVGEAETRGTRYLLLASGEAVVARHCIPAEDSAEDYVAVCESLLNTPYLWGGTSGFGIDCSGLVQLAMRMAGRNVLRDADMQQSSIGTPFQPGDGFSGLRRGDLVFWRGHVAVMADAETIVHATGHTMLVSREPLAAAVERIAYLYGQPVAFRRP